MNPRNASVGVLVAFLTLGSLVPARPAPASLLLRAPARDVLTVDLVLNGGFEWVADSTTRPPKLGAYWKGAFSTRAGDPTGLVVPSGSDHALRLRPLVDEVSQVVTPYGPYADSLVLTVSVRALENTARLRLDFDSGREGGVSYRLGGADDAVPPVARDRDGFLRYELPVGADLAARTGRPAFPWSRIRLRAEGGPVLVDDVHLRHDLPRFSAPELRELLLDDVRDALTLYLAPPDGEEGLFGLGLVDADTGYLTRPTVDAYSGKPGPPARWVGISGIHDLMVRYLRVDDDPAAAPLRALVLDRLEKHLRNLLARNVLQQTGLYCLFDLEERKPFTQAALSPGHFIRYALDAAESIGDEELTRRTLAVCERMARTLLRLRAEHDLPSEVPFGRGPGGNWFGRLPDRVTAWGWLARPKAKTYDQAWAIQHDRSWYHDFDPLVGILRVHGLRPSPDWLDAARGVVERFDRRWDATRYDLENDTDDHYGKNVESALLAYRYAGYRPPELLAFVQAATDHRLRRGEDWAKSVWIEGNRLGSFTTGDQPRAYLGPAGLYTLPPEANPVSAGEPAYLHALAELARSDLKRRILDDGWMTEASSYQWRMIAACFRGDLIGPCCEDRDWEGDMGDQFAGPSANAFRALGRVLRVLPPGPDLEFLAFYAQVFVHTLERYRLPYGYLYGLPVETGRRYEIPDRYLQGFRSDVPYGFAVFAVHAETLDESLAGRRCPRRLDGARLEREQDGTLALLIEGPADARVRVVWSRSSRLHWLGPTDARLLFADREAGTETVLTLDEHGHGRVSIPVDLAPGAPLWADVLLLGADEVEAEDVLSGGYSAP